MVIVSESNSLDHLYLKDYIFEKGISRKKKILIGLKTDSAILIPILEKQGFKKSIMLDILGIMCNILHVRDSFGKKC